MNTTQKRLFFASFLFSLLAFIFHFFIARGVVYGDGRYYYSYLPTFLIQHTFDFSKSFQVYGLPFIYTPTHFLQNAHTIGPALIWALPYLLEYDILSLFQNANPYNVLLQIPIGIVDISLVFAGLFLVFQTLNKFFAINIAFIVTLTIFFATDLFFYGAVDVINSHSITFFFAALFLYIWFSKISLRNAIVLGLSLGMLILSRTQDALFAILPLSMLLEKKLKYLPYFLIISVITVLVFLPQSFLWHMLWGNWFKNPYLYGATFDFLHPHILGVLFNTYDGLFLWTPITLLATAGLIIYFKTNKKLVIPLLLIFLLTLYLISSFEIWWGGASFSARYFISTLPLLSFGLASVYEKYLSVKRQWFISIFFSLLNFVLIFYFLIQK